MNCLKRDIFRSEFNYFFPIFSFKACPITKMAKISDRRNSTVGNILPCSCYGNIIVSRTKKLLRAENHTPWRSALVAYHICLDLHSLGTDVPVPSGSDNNVIDHLLQATMDRSKLNKPFFNLISNIQFVVLSLLEIDPIEFAKIHTPLFFLLFRASLLPALSSLLRKCGVLNLSVSNYGFSYMCRGAPVNIRHHARTHSFPDSCLRVFHSIFFHHRGLWHSVMRFARYDLYNGKCNLVATMILVNEVDINTFTVKEKMT